MLHSWFFTLECIDWWLFKLYDVVNSLLHTEHWNSFSALWMMRCLFKLDAVVKLFEQTWQMWFFTLLCFTWCSFIWDEGVVWQVSKFKHKSSLISSGSFFSTLILVNISSSSINVSVFIIILSSAVVDFVYTIKNIIINYKHKHNITTLIGGVQ